MNKQQLKPIMIASLISVLVGGLLGCQPQQEPQQQVETSQTETATALIQAHIVPVKGVQTLSCEKDDCTKFDFQTIQSNVPWIDDYFLERIRRAEPVAFQVNESAASEVMPTGTASELQVQPEQALTSVEQRAIQVAFLGQRNDFATFVIKSYQVKTGAEHGLYHNEYVNLDLTQKKRLALQDVMKKGSEQKLLDALYEANIFWLNAHDIDKSKLKLSDNFYFAASGLVLVYPLYELVDYGLGMPELKVPYVALNGIVEPQYLTALQATKP